MTHTMKLNFKPFELIENGIKTIEYRLNDEKRQLLKVGDTITFSRLPELTEELSVTITKLKSFRTLLEMYSDTFDLYLKDYYATPQVVVDDTTYYTNEEVQKHGCLAIHFKKL